MRLRLAALALLAAACAPAAEEAPAAPQAVTITTTDFAFAAPDTIAPGMTTITLTNAGAQPHHIIMARLDEGKTVDDLVADFNANPTSVPVYATWHGANSTVMPGSSSTTTINLPAGTYALLCFVPDPADGAPHFAKGMARTIIATGEPNTAPAPAATAELRLSDFAFTGDLAAGEQVVRVVNDGPQVHEVELVRLNDGATMDDYMAAMQAGPGAEPPGAPAGGTGALSVGLENYWHLNLAPGNYLMVCFVPDPADGAPHVMKGMVKAFTVPAA